MIMQVAGVPEPGKFLYFKTCFKIQTKEDQQKI
jgi:hypothetical protein